MCMEIKEKRNKEEKGPENLNLMQVECEFCGSLEAFSDSSPGVYICTRCYRDIVSTGIHH